MNHQNNFAQPVLRFKRFLRKKYGAFVSLRRVVNIGVVSGCVLTSMTIPSVKAQTVSAREHEKVMEEELEEVMVTAARVTTPLNQSAKLVTVITKQDIEQAPVRSIQDLLVYAANIDVIQRGGHGVQADISIRGGTYDQNAILLNGINLTNAHTGHYNLDIPVNLSDIERIEIIHGPSALLYGASAFSGGINIITKKEVEEHLFARLEGGMHGLRAVEARGAMRSGKAVHSLSAGYKGSEGYIDGSDYTMYNLLWQSRLHVKEKGRLDIFLGNNEKRYGANTFYSAAYPDQYEHTRTYTGSVKGEFGSRLKWIPIFYWSRHHDRFELIRGTATGRNFHRNDTYGGNLIFTYRSRLGVTSLGGEWRREDIVSSVLGKPRIASTGKYTHYDDRTTSSVTLEHTAGWNRFLLAAGMLLGHNTLNGDKVRLYPSVNLSYRLLNDLKVYASWNQSSRIPTFTDLYYSTETHIGNKTLSPENSRAWEVGGKYNGSLFSAYLTGFLLQGRDIIDWIEVEQEGDKMWASWNLTRINTRGIEGGFRIHLSPWLPLLGPHSLLAVNYARLHQSSDTQGYKSKYVLNYLRDKFTLNFRYLLFSAIEMDWHLRAQKRMGQYTEYIDGKAGSNKDFPAYATMDLKISYPWRDFTFFGQANNLFNHTYFDLGNIPQPGFWFTGGVSYTLR